MAQNLKPKRSPPLEIVERVVRNLPITKPEFLSFDTDIGPVYVALGKDGFGRFHGVWAFTRGIGMAQPLEFAPNQMRSLVIKELFNSGYAMMSELHQRGMLADHYFRR